MAIPRTQPFQSLQTRRGNPQQQQQQQQLLQLLQLIAQQSQGRAASGPPTALPTPFRQDINRAPLPPARVNPLNALDQLQRGTSPSTLPSGAIPPGLLPGLPAGPQFVPGSPGNVQGNFAGTTIPAPILPPGAAPRPSAPGSVFSDITAGGVRPGTPGIPGPLPSTPQVNRRSGPSPAAGAAAARGLQGLPGQSLLRAGKTASQNSGEDIAGRPRDSVSKDQAKKTQDLSKRVAGVPKSAKNAPAWALPLMMMGLTMAASKRTDTLGAFSEGGLAGLQLFMQQKSTKRKAATEERKLRVAEEKGKAATTTAEAAERTSKASLILARAKGAASGPVGKRFDDLQRIFNQRGQAGKALKTDITPAELERVVTGLPDPQFEAFKVLLKAAADAQFLADKPLTTEQIKAVAEAARTAGAEFARTSGETPPAAVTGSRRTIGPEGIF